MWRSSAATASTSAPSTKTRDDRIILTRNDGDAGGRHHSIPSRWLTSVDDEVTIGKTAAEARQHWRDDDGSSAMVCDEPRGSTGPTGFGGTTATATGSTTSNTSYSSTSTTS